MKVTVGELCNPRMEGQVWVVMRVIVSVRVRLRM